MNDKFPTINEKNVETWRNITYVYILRGMIETENLPYGEAMTYADKLTKRIFKDVKKIYRLKRGGLN